MYIVFILYIVCIVCILYILPCTLHRYRLFLYKWNICKSIFLVFIPVKKKYLDNIIKQLFLILIILVISWLITKKTNYLSMKILSDANWSKSWRYLKRLKSLETKFVSRVATVSLNNSALKITTNIYLFSYLLYQYLHKAIFKVL